SLETVLASNRNSVTAMVLLGQCKRFTWAIEETILLTEHAIRLSPRDPALGVWYQQIGVVHLLRSRSEKAILWLEKAPSANPAQPVCRGWLAAAYGLNGRTRRR